MMMMKGDIIPRESQFNLTFLKFQFWFVKKSQKSKKSKD